MAARRIRQPHPGANPRAGAVSDGESPAGGPILDRPRLISEVVTLVLCGPSAPIVMVLVARHGWPPWWLVVAGMLLAWAGDALWTVGDHLVAVADRPATVDGPREAGTGELGAPGVSRRRRRGQASRAGDQP